MKTDQSCPRCHEGNMQTWEKMNAEEREVIKRLPASADYSAAEREATHRWCRRCWYEATGAREESA